jgi:peptidoglycan glycosyltransferase
MQRSCAESAGAGKAETVMKKYEDEPVRRRGRENGRDRDFDDFSEDDRYDQGEYEERMDRYDRAYEDRRRNSGQKKKGKKKPFSIVFLSALFTVLLCSMLFYVCDYSAENKEKLINNSYNGRQQILLSQNTRGSIMASDGTVLAKTTTDAQGNEVREYPFSNEFAHVVGYASQGRAGVEAMANYYLINSNVSIAEKAKDDASKQKYPGDDVYTTLNTKLQEIAYKSLGVYRGAVVVSDPKTGAILAMVSKPDFDPNSIDQDWKTLVADKDNSELLNRATQGLYPPGSTFKIMTSLEYIRENPDTYKNYRFNCTGSYTHGQDTIKCFHGEHHGQLDFFGSFAKSCNSSYANISMTLDRSSFKKTLTELMFNSELPLEMNYSKSVAISEETTSDSDIMQLAIGQGTTAMTPIHLNMITCAIANGGDLMKPYLIDHVQTANGKMVKQFEAGEYKRLMTQDEASVLTEMMKGVVQNGTATKLKGLSYTAAGKTGSAEYSNLTSDSHAWFTGFAPADDPKICVTIIIEKAGSGGEYAVPVAKRIFDAYFGA